MTISVGGTVAIVSNAHVYPTYVVVYDVIFLVVNWSPESEGASTNVVYLRRS